MQSEEGWVGASRSALAAASAPGRRNIIVSNIICTVMITISITLSTTMNIMLLLLLLL